MSSPAIIATPYRPWLLLPLMLLLSVAARAQGLQTKPPLVVDRPYHAIPTGIVAPGYLQVESGVAMEQDESGSRTARVRQRSLAWPALAARLGLLRGVELRLGAEYLDETITDIKGAEAGRRLGLHQVTIGAKMRVSDEDGAIPSAAFLLDLELPLGHDGLAPAFTQPRFLLALANRPGDDLAITYSLGARWNPTDGSALALYAAAFSASFIPQATAFVELHGDLSSTTAPAHSLGAGITYRIGRSVQLDLSGGKGLNRAAASSYVGIGIAFRVGIPGW